MVNKKELALINLQKQLPPPKVQIIDLNEEKKLGNYSLISDALRSYIFKSLQKKRRLLIFYNKLGSSSSFRCLDCGNPFACPRCNKSLIIEKTSKNDHRLHCTLCGYTADLPLSCPVCNGVRLKQRGSGIQKIGVDIATSFPQARVHVLSDKRSLYIPANSDIVIGAQRALDHSIFIKFHGLIVLSADTFLRLPDFSSTETTFRQIAAMTQHAARLGLDLIIQTSFPNHYAIKSAITNNMNLFYHNELSQRSDYRYPPFAELVRLFVKGKDKQAVSSSSQALYDRLQLNNKLPLTLEILQPGPSFIEKIRGQYSWQLVMKFPPSDWPAVKNLISLTTDDWLVDINPLNLLSY